ncbi:hypothetical protein CDAR_189841 [Caerostris darwini]|uniref:Uncharacterized protein n=1 Tax=Caerostris darwini TaxID=1538125 RepID=A0AAV4VL58_9ARAC|nr:hypothetical protein CDAR_189841 [Caerostris darwini]
MELNQIQIFHSLKKGVLQTKDIMGAHLKSAYVPPIKNYKNGVKLMANLNEEIRLRKKAILRAHLKSSAKIPVLQNLQKKRRETHKTTSQDIIQEPITEEFQDTTREDENKDSEYRESTRGSESVNET